MVTNAGLNPSTAEITEQREALTATMLSATKMSGNNDHFGHVIHGIDAIFLYLPRSTSSLKHIQNITCD